MRECAMKMRGRRPLIIQLLHHGTGTQMLLLAGYPMMNPLNRQEVTGGISGMRGVREVTEATEVTVVTTEATEVRGMEGMIGGQGIRLAIGSVDLLLPSLPQKKKKQLKSLVAFEQQQSAQDDEVGRTVLSVRLEGKGKRRVLWLRLDRKHRKKFITRRETCNLWKVSQFLILVNFFF